jgi:Nif-specific regulatory protein
MLDVAQPAELIQNELCYAPPSMSEPRRVERERDFYRRLLELSHAASIEPLLEEALALAVEVSDAERVYLRLNQRGDEAPHAASLAYQLDPGDLDTIERRISQGIIAEALAAGRTIQTPAAFLDARFRDRASVRTNEIQAVLCAPIGQPEPAGVLYLEGRRGAGAFDEDVLRLFEAFARHLGLLVHRLLEERERAEATDPTAPFREKLDAGHIIGRSEALAKLLEQIASVSALRGIDVLLTGDAGTGKTAIGQLLARSGPRAKGEFVTLSCANLSEELLEADLFGARAGAHSTAHQDLPGKLETAEGGTLFLDEVAELSSRSQAKLLQFLQSREYYPLGDPQLRKADVRVIAATNADLHALVREGKFRQDLLFRLQVLDIRVPSLAERKEDIPSLMRHFLERAAEENAVGLLPPSASAVRAACEAPWPGNVRQLENACKAAFVRAVSERATEVEARHLFPESAAAAEPKSYQEATRRFQRDLVRATLEKHRWNVSQAARELDLTRGHLYNLIQSFGLARP